MRSRRASGDAMAANVSAESGTVVALVVFMTSLPALDARTRSMQPRHGGASVTRPG
jgi:hypothetical protein